MKKKNTVMCILIVSAIAYPLFDTFIFGKNSNQQKEQSDSKHIRTLANGLSKASISQVEWNKLSCQEKLSLLERLIMINYSIMFMKTVIN